MGRRPTNFQIARVLGIRIGVGPSWFFVLFFYILGLSPFFHSVLGGSRTSAYALAVLSALAFFASIALHELGHALAARREGLEVTSIDLWALGGLARMNGEPDTPGAEFRIAAAGPLVTLLIVAAGFVAGEIVHPGHFVDVATGVTGFRVSPGIVFVGWLTSINVIVLALNLVPAFPLDGGRIARALVWWRTGDRLRGTRAAGRIGQGFAAVLGVFGLLLVARGYGYGLWLGLLALFIYPQAKAAVMSSDFGERISGVRVGDIMDREPVTVPATTPLLEIEDQFFLRYRWPWFAVVDGAGRYLGLVRRERVHTEIEGGRPALTAAELVEPGDMAARVTEDAPLEALLRSEGLRRLGAVVAVDEQGVLRGIVTMGHLQQALAPLAGRTG